MNTRLNMPLTLFVILLQCLGASLASAQTVLRVPSQYPTIQSALDASPDNAIVLVSPGTYNENPGVANHTGLTIQGNGGRPVVKGGFNIVNCQNVTVQGFECDGAGNAAVSAEGGGNISVADIWAFGGQLGIWLRNFVAGKTCTVTDCSVSGAQWGIYLDAGTNPTVRRCTVTNTHNWGIFLNTGFGSGLVDQCSVSNSGLSNIFAIGNKDNRTDTIEVSTCTSTGSLSYYGIEVNGVHSSFIHDCTAFGNHLYGFVNWYCNTATDRNCISHDNYDGFDFYTCRNAAADHCLAYHNAQSGVVMLNAEAKYGTASAQVQNCTLANNPSGGVYTLSGWTVTLRNTIAAFNGWGVAQTGNTIIRDDYNDLYGNSNAPFNWTPQGTHNIAANPLFDTQFHLGFNSPCIDTGDPMLLDPDGSRSDEGSFYCNLPIRCARLGVPRYVQDPPGSQHISVKVFFKGIQQQNVSGRWLNDGSVFAYVNAFTVDLSSLDWTEGPELQIDLVSGNHVVNFALDTPNPGWTSTMQISSTGFRPDKDGWNFDNSFFNSILLGHYQGVCLGMTCTARGYYVAHRALPNLWSPRAKWTQIRSAYSFENAVGQNIDMIRLTGLTPAQMVDAETNKIFDTRLTKLDPCDIGLLNFVNGSAIPEHAVLGITGFKASNVYDQYQHEEVRLLRLVAVYDPNYHGVFRHFYVSQSASGQYLRWLADGLPTHTQPINMMITDAWQLP
jgi:parallel beta-helix repeat protein